MKSLGAKKLAIVLGFVLAVGGYAALQGPAQLHYHNVRSTISNYCSEDLSTTVFDTYLSQAWYDNKHRPGTDANEHMASQIREECAQAPGFQLWVSELDQIGTNESASRLSNWVSEFHKQQDEAYAYAEFSYAYMQYQFAKKAVLFPAMRLTPIDLGFAPHEDLDILENGFESILNIGGVDAGGVLASAEQAREKIAVIQQKVRESEVGPEMEDLLKALDPVYPVADPAKSQGLLPFFLPERFEMPEGDAYAQARPQFQNGLKFDRVETQDYRHPVVFYSGFGSGSVAFSQVEQTPQDFILELRRNYDYLPIPSGYGNEYCVYAESESACWLPAADGRYFRAKLQGSLSSAESRAALQGWMRMVAEGK
ncbi:hypothetical protein HMPREF0044_0700 [Gleimia coleocanis DSM 15436]|uniref:Uncharacterized protein n=1 Tax=Gleimia coleocanis DSM 15436 TaxID=525245 RepID=C0W0V7_9ACTO|nr:hypothetical protein [Gleimia coleocanis]EEH63681.1 hypothetical protein HMPREF0044_0700 [Gleimia coleocanis DSM 15436]